VELDVAGDLGDGGFAGFAGGKSPAFLDLRGLARSGGRGRRTQAGGFSAGTWRGRVLAGQGKAATESVAVARVCGKLIPVGGMSAAAAPVSMILQSAW
jgi:hypothetical protein